jgi:sigma-B regulation protein RsbU (phosphoserine phosphatase)
VAGDYYDYITVGPGLLAIALADVSGKGISASLLRSNLQASLRAQAGALKDAGPEGPIVAGGAAGGPAANGAVARLASSLNAQLCRSTDINRYATLFLALYDERTRVLRYTNAGHNAAVLVREDGSVRRLSHGGTIVGAFEGASYGESFEGLGPGSVLLVFSDGISEAQNAEGAEFGEDRIASFVVDNRHRSAEEIRRLLFVEVDSWSIGVERGDDQTLVIVKERGPAS